MEHAQSELSKWHPDCSKIVHLVFSDLHAQSVSHTYGLWIFDDFCICMVGVGVDQLFALSYCI